MNKILESGQVDNQESVKRAIMDQIMSELLNLRKKEQFEFKDGRKRSSRAFGSLNSNESNLNRWIGRFEALNRAASQRELERGKIGRIVESEEYYRRMFMSHEMYEKYKRDSKNRGRRSLDKIPNRRDFKGNSGTFALVRISQDSEESSEEIDPKKFAIYAKANSGSSINS
jgi:Zn-dependent oligopeptidase